MRKVTAFLSALAAAGALAATAPAHAATTLSAGWNAGCGKSTCFNDQGVFTRTFSARDFSGPVTIGQLLLERGVLGALDSSTFRLSFALNGETLETWGAYTMGGIGGDWLTFGGEAFTWNPEDGDLVLVLALVPPPRAGAGGFFASGLRTQDEPFGPAGPFAPSTNQDASFQAALPAPEPSTWALTIGGFGLAGAMLRRRRVAAPARP